MAIDRSVDWKTIVFSSLLVLSFKRERVGYLTQAPVVSALSLRRDQDFLARLGGGDIYTSNIRPLSTRTIELQNLSCLKPLVE